MSIIPYMSELRRMRNEFVKCETSSYKQRGLRRIGEAERLLPRNFDQAMTLMDEARYELNYAREYTLIQELRDARRHTV